MGAAIKLIIALFLESTFRELWKMLVSRASKFLIESFSWFKKKIRRK